MSHTLQDTRISNSLPSSPKARSKNGIEAGATQDLAAQIHRVLRILGEDPAREGLRETPKRYAKAMEFLTSGYEIDLRQIVGKALFNEDSEDMVLVRDIEFYSLCEHHLLPFWGKAHVAYLPQGKVIGLSKIPRIVDAFARRLQVQERLTTQVARALCELTGAHGSAVVIEASHMCMMMRGVQKQASTTITRSLQGTFKTDAELQKEFRALLRG